jgi:hypothetical protein
MKPQDVQDGIYYFDGLFFLNKKIIKSNDAVVEETFKTLYQFINYN